MSDILQQHSKHRYNLKHRFEIVKALGSGTYGKVKLAIDKKTGQKVRSCSENVIFDLEVCNNVSEAHLSRIKKACLANMLGQVKYHIGPISVFLLSQTKTEID